MFFLHSFGVRSGVLMHGLNSITTWVRWTAVGFGALCGG